MEGKPFVRNGKTLLSGIDPVRRAERTADAVSLRDNTLYFCPSPLYCYGIERLLSRLEKEAPNSAVLCVEADPELFNLTLENIPSLIADSKNLHITNICKASELAALVNKMWSAKAIRRIETIRFTGGCQLFPEIYGSIYDTLCREIAVNWSNALTMTKLGRLYIRNLFRNLALVPHFPSITQLSFGDDPVLVLGAGPSLDETLDAVCKEHLTKNKEQRTRTEGSENREQSTDNAGRAADKNVSRTFKIICVDTCLRALKDRGIVPDLVVILESQHWNLRDFTGCRGWNVSAAVDLSALPASARLLGGKDSKHPKGFLFFTPWTQLRVFERLKKAGLLSSAIPPLGSVGLTAVELARRLTKGKIICAGLDFSFTADKYHARSTPGHRSLLKTQTRFRRIFNAAVFSSGVFSVVSKSGVSVYCNPIMKNYRDLFEREFADDERLRDIEGTGLSLGIKTITIKEAIEILENKNFNHEPTQTNTNQCSNAEQYVRGVSVVSGKNPELNNFFQKEKKHLKELRNILTGDIAPDKNRLNILNDECDYLWAHFPDCTGGRHPGLEDISFLKRVRTEIDPMLKLMEWN